MKKCSFYAVGFLLLAAWDISCGDPAVDAKLASGLEHMVLYGDPYPYVNGVRPGDNHPTGQPHYMDTYAYVLLEALERDLDVSVPYSTYPNTPDDLILEYIAACPVLKGNTGNLTHWPISSPTDPPGAPNLTTPPPIREPNINPPTMICKSYIGHHGTLSQPAREAIENEALKFVNALSQIDPHGSGWNTNSNPEDDWRDDFTNADKTSWFHAGSENHNLGTYKIGLLLSTHVLMISPNHGPDYVLLDGHTVRQHYEAWVDFFKRYVKDRAREGVNCEIDNPTGYGKTTIRALYDLYDDSGSAVLRELAGKLLTLYWAQSAQEYLSTAYVRGGIATNRIYDWIDYTRGDNWCRPVFYAYDWTALTSPQFISTEKFRSDEPTTSLASIYASDYQPPEIVKNIAQAERPAFQATSRHFGLGTEDAKNNLMQFDANGAYIRRDTYWTPSYVLGGLSVDQTKEYYTGSGQTRLVGVAFSTSRYDRIAIMGDRNGTAGDALPSDWHENYGHNSTMCAINSVLKGDAMIVARDTNAASSHGGDEEEPHPGELHPGVSVFVSAGTLWNNGVMDQAGGWFFTKTPDAYAAVHVVNGSGGLSGNRYEIVHYKEGVNNDKKDIGKFLRPYDKWSPIIVQMGKPSDYESFAAFQAWAQNRSMSYVDGKLTYLSGQNTFEYWSQSTTLPKVDGTTLNVNPPLAYSSPYLSGNYGSDLVTVSLSGNSSLNLDFSSVTNDEFDNGVIPGQWTFNPANQTNGLTAQTATGTQLDPSGTLDPNDTYLEPQDSWMEVAKTGTTEAHCFRAFSPRSAGLVSVEWRLVHLAGKEFFFNIRSNASPAKSAVNLRIKEYDPDGTGPLPPGLYLCVHNPAGGSSDYPEFDNGDANAVEPYPILTGKPYKIKALIDTTTKAVEITVDDELTRADDGSLPTYTGPYDIANTANVAKLDFHVNNNVGNQNSRMVFDDIRILDQD